MAYSPKDRGSITRSCGMSRAPSQWAVNIVIRSKGTRLGMWMRAGKWGSFVCSAVDTALSRVQFPSMVIPQPPRHSRQHGGLGRTKRVFEGKGVPDSRLRQRFRKPQTRWAPALLDLLPMNQRHNAWHPRPIGWGEGRGEGRVSCSGSWPLGRSACHRKLPMNLRHSTSSPSLLRGERAGSGVDFRAPVHAPNSR